MLISCNACAAVNVVDGDRPGKSTRCVICRKKLVGTPQEAETRQSFRARAGAITSRGGRFSQEPTRVVTTQATVIEEMLAESVAKIPHAPMWGKNDDGKTSPDPLMLAALEKKIQAVAQTEASEAHRALSEQLEATREVLLNGEDAIEDEEDEDLISDPPPDSEKPPTTEGKWLAPTVPSIPAAKRRQVEKHRQTHFSGASRWFVAGSLLLIGLSVGSAGAAIANAHEMRSTDPARAARQQSGAVEAPADPRDEPTTAAPATQVIPEVDVENLPVSAPFAANESSAEVKP